MLDFLSVLFFILKKFLKGMKVFCFWRKSSEQCHLQFPASRYGKIRTPFVVDLGQKRLISKGQSATDCRRFPLVSTVFPFSTKLQVSFYLI